LVSCKNVGSGGVVTKLDKIYVNCTIGLAVLALALTVTILIWAIMI